MTLVVFVGWIINIVFTLFFLPPSDDGNFFFEGALAIRYKGEFGRFLGNEFVSSFIQFPTFSFFQAVFLFLGSLLQLPVNIWTYRIFHLLCVALLLYGTFKCFGKIITESKYSVNASRNIFLILLGITPFAQNCWQLRPEVFELTCIVFGLNTYFSSLTFSQSKKLYCLVVSGLFFGIAAVTHPNGSIVTGIIVIFLSFIYWEKNSLRYLCVFWVTLSIPTISLVSWFALNYPESVHTFVGHAIGKTVGNTGAFHRLLQESLFLGSWDSKIIQVFYFIFWAPLLILLSVNTLFLVKTFFLKKKLDELTRLFMMLYGILIILVLINRGTDSYFVIYAYLCVFCTVVYLFRPQLTKTFVTKARKRYRGVFWYLLAMLMVTAHSAIHAAKFLSTETDYYFLPETHRTISEAVKEDDYVVLGYHGKQTPLFYDLLEEQYRSKGRKPRILPLYPIKTQRLQGERLKKNLKEFISETPHDQIIWGLLKRRTDYRTGVSSFGWHVWWFDAVFEIDNVLYEDKDQIFFRASKIAVVN